MELLNKKQRLIAKERIEKAAYCEKQYAALRKYYSPRISPII